MFKVGEVSVQKFGGTSMGSVERIDKVAHRIAEQAARGKRLAVVVSAMGSATDDLLALLNKVHTDPDRRESDQMIATGEMVSASLLATALRKLGINSRSFNAFNLGIMSEALDNEYEITSFTNISVLAEFLRPACVAVVTGFQGMDTDGNLTTLGRGGSDITAVALTRELGQKVCEKYTDEDGIYSADPRLIPSAKKIWHIDYEEMELLSRYGSKILHPRALSWAKANDIRIHVRSSFSREEGSIVGPDGDPTIQVKSIACDRKQPLVVIEGVRSPPESILHALQEYEFVPTAFEERVEADGTVSYAICYRISDSFWASPSLWQLADRVKAREVKFKAGVYVITIVGSGLKHNRNLVAAIVRILENSGIPVLLFQHCQARITFVVNEEHGLSALETVHAALENLCESVT